MAEYWKSTPKYWCKHCSIFVRDTKLERANHEATGKHQGAIKRSLRDLHRNHEQAEREKDRAKREVERLNGVVSGSRSGSSFSSPAPAGTSSGGQSLTKEEQQRQLEQLASLGVNIPTELRPELALAGEWTVTSTRVIKDDIQDAESKDLVNPGARAAGVRKRDREKIEEEKEEEDALKSLFKKPKRWGRETKSMPAEGDDELDALLSGPLVKAKKEEEEDGEGKVKPDMDSETNSEGMVSPDASASAPVKEEQEVPQDVLPLIKHESTGNPDGLASDKPSGANGQGEGSGSTPAVVFKKRKAKNLRQH